ncbi:MAG: SCO1664 family protein [Candidatus Nanopelagicaceae bacterium]
MVTADKIHELERGDIEIVGRLVNASNASLYCRVGSVSAIYKPIAGERPLWDFPDGHLAWREVATYKVSEALGLNCVPPTILRDGPFGEGSFQLWIEDCEEVGERYLEQSDGLRKIALLDAVVNNTDRKIGHLLYKNDEIYGCDHGVTFHEDFKLRTVLWQFADLPLSSFEERALGEFQVELEHLLTQSELEALNQRIDELLQSKKFPLPPTDWPAIPWPPF